MVSLLAAAPVLAEEPARDVRITVDGQSAGRPLRAVWAYFGYDEVNYTTTDEGRELLEVLSAASDAPVHVRTHFLFNSGDGTPALKWGSTNIYTQDDQGAAIYDFRLIDRILDAKLAAGVTPLFELGFMPRALSTRPEPYQSSGTYNLDSGSFYPPTSYEEWGKLVASWAEHARDRYALGTGQNSWLWELWNEPDIGYWQGTPAEFSRLYDYTEAALHAVLPDAPLGGPAVATPETSFLEDFLEHCATGENALTGERGTRLDFVTFHAKGGVVRVDDHVQLDLGRQLSLHRAGFDTVARSAFATAPIIITEADPDGCAACPSSVARHLDYRHSPAYGAYEVAMMKRSLEQADDVGVDLHGVLTWAFTYPGTPYFAGYRALATNGLHLPVLSAFKLLGKLRGERLEVHSSGALALEDLEQSGVRGEPDIDALATRDERQLQVLVWHYHDDLVPAPAARVTLEVAVPAALGERLLLRHQRVDDAHGNAFTAWQAQGRPAPPSAQEREQLLTAMSSLELEPARVVRAEGGVVTVSFELPRFGVSLLTLSAAPEPAAATATGGCSFGAPAEASPHRAWLLLVALFGAAARGGISVRRRRP